PNKLNTRKRLPMLETKILEISSDQQAWMLQELRRCRYGYFLALHILLLYVRGKKPTEIADFLLCARLSVYRAIEVWQMGKLGDQWWPQELPVVSEHTEPLGSLPAESLMDDQAIAASLQLVSHEVELRGARAHPRRSDWTSSLA